VQVPDRDARGTGYGLVGDAAQLQANGAAAFINLAFLGDVAVRWHVISLVIPYPALPCRKLQKVRISVGDKSKRWLIGAPFALRSQA